MSADGPGPGPVTFSSLDTPLAAGYPETKRDLVGYLDAMADRLVPVLAGRALTVVRVNRGEHFVQKNLPAHAPDWVRTVTVHSEAGHRDVRYALCDDRATLLWFANQRAVEYHPQLFLGTDGDRPTHLVVDLDPPEGGAFAAVVTVALAVRQVLDDAGLRSAVKTSGSKGVHVVVPLAGESAERAAAATRAVAARAALLEPTVATTAYVRDEREGKVFVDATRSGGATVAAAYTPRLRPGLTVSMPVAWEDLPDLDPRAATVRTVPGMLGDADPWRDLLPAPQPLDEGLVEEGRLVPVARVAAMHEGRRRARARREAEG
ncbi:DNA polymerase domain-containing protein [Cellulomonas endophytica]|uniref:DNA polymerase domain-containing protein n=1 Tax=Cellulomonas endophytica TaxID=2494735 RepID=UPI0010120264|nr:ATP-dependent DNA ligase [Cellulomonas endophytica]